MNALKTLHGSIITPICERLADHYCTIKITYRADQAHVSFSEWEGGLLEIAVLHYRDHYGSNSGPHCYLRRYSYTDRRGANCENLLTNGTPEQLYAAINKLIAERKQP